MKQQIARFSPHQNGKVFAVLMAINSLIFLVPFFALFGLVAPAQQRMPMVLLIILPLMYLVVGYVMVGVGCILYNFIFKYVGGIEFESTEEDA
jgi:hypothetical protein